MTKLIFCIDMIQVAFRNILRNPRRTILNVIALGLGMSIMLASLGWMRGYFSTLYSGMINLDTGHVQLLHRDYLDEERRMPLDLVIDDYRTVRSELSRRSGVSAVSGRIHYDLELGNGREYMPMRGRGIDFDHEFDITRIRDFMESEGAETGVLIGRTAAELLGVQTGDTVFIRVRDRHAAPNTTTMTVAGVFSTGYPLFDRYLVLSDLQETSQLLRMDNSVTHMALRLEDGLNPQRFAAMLNNELSPDMEAYRWQRFARSMVAAVEADIGAFSMLIGILFLLIILGILNSMSMTVRERNREIGTMRAIGMKRRELSALLLTEGAVIALLSSVVALLIGGSFAAYVQFVGFDIAQFMPPDLPIPFGDRFYGDYRIPDYLISLGIGVAAAVLGTLIPIRRAARLNVVETMRSGAV
ncbi:ABC transporter permease [Spirochaeta dissipatitropha]